MIVYVPPGALVDVAVVVSAADPVTTDGVSLFTNPAIVALRSAIGSLYCDAAGFAVTVRIALFIVNDCNTFGAAL